MTTKKNEYDRTGSSQDFANNEGLHNYKELVDQGQRSQPQFSDSQKSQFDDGMSWSEKNDYRNEADNTAPQDDHRYESRFSSTGSATPAEKDSPQFVKPDSNNQFTKQTVTSNRTDK